MSALRRFLALPALHLDLGLLVLRLGLGIPMLLFHGWGKITGGVARWERVGGSMQNLGIDFAPTLWGFLAAFAESVGSILIVLGLLTRPAATLLAATMFVAATRHLSLPAGEPGAGWKAASHALELFAVSATIILAGPGRYSLDRLLWARIHRPKPD